MQNIHPTVEIGVGVQIEGNVTIGEGCKIGAYSIITGDTIIGKNNVFSPHTIIGGDPQDHKFKGGGKLTVGNDNIFREFTTLHRGHLTETGTIIKDNNHFFTSTHVGHDCIVGNNNTFVNQTGLAGHVTLGNNNNVSGNVCVHQFCNIGDHCMISALSGIRQDIPSYAMVLGDPAKIIGINQIGLKRAGWNSDEINLLKEGYRLFRANLSGDNKYLCILNEFKKQSQRGLISFSRRRR